MLLLQLHVLTLHLQVFLCLEVLDCRVVYDANHRHAVVLLVHGERQAAGDGVHLVVGQLNSGLAWREQRRAADLNTELRARVGFQLKYERSSLVF